MKYSTIKYIYELLADKLETKRNEKEVAYMAYLRAESDNSIKSMELESLFYNAERDFNAVRDALKDFESHEWR